MSAGAVRTWALPTAASSRARRVARMSVMNDDNSRIPRLPHSTRVAPAASRPTRNDDEPIRRPTPHPIRRRFRSRRRTRWSSCRGCGIRSACRFPASGPRRAGDAGRRSGAAGLPFPNPAAMFATLDPAEVERKIGELKVIEGWLQMSLNLMQMSIKTMELQKASLEALRGSHPHPEPTRQRSRPRIAARADVGSCSRFNPKGFHESRPLLRFRLSLRVARAARARAQGAALRAQGAVVFRRRHAQARVHRAQSAPPRAGAGRRRFRALRIERDRRIPRRSVSGDAARRCFRATRARARSCAG